MKNTHKSLLLAKSNEANHVLKPTFSYRLQTRISTSILTEYIQQEFLRLIHVIVQHLLKQYLFKQKEQNVQKVHPIYPSSLRSLIEKLYDQGHS